MLLQEAHYHLVFIIAVCAAFVIFAAMYLLLCIESLFRRWLTLFGVTIWICFLIVGYVSLFEKENDYQLWEQVCISCLFRYMYRTGSQYIYEYVCILFFSPECYNCIIMFHWDLDSFLLRFRFLFLNWLYGLIIVNFSLCSFL